MAIADYQHRSRNEYPKNCSECGKYIESRQGYLFKNTKYRNSRGYHAKCEDCCSGATAKRLKQAEKEMPTRKTLSITFAKKWCESLQFKIITDDWGVYCEVHNNGTCILGWCPILFGCRQEYPTEDWCQEQAGKISGYFTDNAISYICERLTTVIQERIAEGQILELIQNDSHPLSLIPLDQVVSSVKEVERKHIDAALIRLRILGKIELRTMKSGVANSLGINTVEINGVNYGSLKYTKDEVTQAV